MVAVRYLACPHDPIMAPQPFELPVRPSDGLFVAAGPDEGRAAGQQARRRRLRIDNAPERRDGAVNQQTAELVGAYVTTIA